MFVDSKYSVVFVVLESHLLLQAFIVILSLSIFYLFICLLKVLKQNGKFLHFIVSPSYAVVDVKKILNKTSTLSEQQKAEECPEYVICLFLCLILGLRGSRSSSDKIFTFFWCTFLLLLLKQMLNLKINCDCFFLHITGELQKLVNQITYHH